MHQDHPGLTTSELTNAELLEPSKKASYQTQHEPNQAHYYEQEAQE
jgi:hypothetical protein